MGDGGGCHPRDNIALSWLAREVGLSHDVFEDIMVAREHQCDWLADLMLEQQRRSGLTVGDPGHRLQGEHQPDDRLPRTLAAVHPGGARRCGGGLRPPRPRCARPVTTSGVSRGTRHRDSSNTYAFPQGSIVLDPWRYIPDQPGVESDPPGAGTRKPHGVAVAPSTTGAAGDESSTVKAALWSPICFRTSSRYSRKCSIWAHTVR